MHPPDEGELRVDGRPVRFDTPGQARARGIATAFQNLATLPLVSIWRNFFLGAEPTRRFGPLRLLDVGTSRWAPSPVASGRPWPSPGRCTSDVETHANRCATGGVQLHLADATG